MDRFARRDRHSCLSHLTPHSLPDELRAELPDSRIAGATDDSEASAADVPARIVELDVVEDVEEFSPNLEGHLLCDRGPLRKPEIGIVETRAVEEPAVGSPESAAVRAGNLGNRIERAIGRGERAWPAIASCARARNRGVKCRTSGIHFTWIHNHHRAHAIRKIRATTCKR